MGEFELNEPVVVTFKSARNPAPIRFDTLRKALHTIILDFEPDLLPSAFICTKKGGLNIVEIRSLYSLICKVHADNLASRGIVFRRLPFDA